MECHDDYAEYAWNVTMVILKMHGMNDDYAEYAWKAMSMPNIHGIEEITLRSDDYAQNAIKLMFVAFRNVIKCEY